jgi:hypothetical protein
LWGGFGSRMHRTDAVVDEIARKIRRQETFLEKVTIALWPAAPIDLSDDESRHTIDTLRERLRREGDLPTQHVGEAATILAARRCGESRSLTISTVQASLARRQWVWSGPWICSRTCCVEAVCPAPMAGPPGDACAAIHASPRSIVLLCAHLCVGSIAYSRDARVKRAARVAQSTEPTQDRGLASPSSSPPRASLPALEKANEEGAGRRGGVRVGTNTSAQRCSAA